MSLWNLICFLDLFFWRGISFLFSDFFCIFFSGCYCFFWIFVRNFIFWDFFPEFSFLRNLDVFSEFHLFSNFFLFFPDLFFFGFFLLILFLFSEFLLLK